MNAQEIKKLERIVFERLVCGEGVASLRAQLATRNVAEADRLITAAEERIARGRGTPEFDRLSKEIRKRRLVAGRYLAWKILAWIVITLAFLSVIASLLTEAKSAGRSAVLFRAALSSPSLSGASTCASI